jgi:hypothetical protein
MMRKALVIIAVVIVLLITVRGGNVLRVHEEEGFKVLPDNLADMRVKS